MLPLDLIAKRDVFKQPLPTDLRRSSFGDRDGCWPLQDSDLAQLNMKPSFGIYLCLGFLDTHQLSSIDSGEEIAEIGRDGGDRVLVEQTDLAARGDPY